MDISIVVLTFNAKDITLKMMDSLKDALDFMDKSTNRKITYEVIVSDNSSTDSVYEEISKRHSGWVKIKRNENIGFAKGNNVGMRMAEPGSKYVLFLNPDIIMSKDSILEIFKFMEENKEVGVATCRVDLWSGGLDYDCHRGFPTPWRAFCYFSGLEKMFGYMFPKIFGGYHLLHNDFNTTHEIDACLGAYMMVRREVGEKINWWPEDYFLNGEDVDFCYQVKVIEKYKIMYVPTTSVVHYKGSSKGTKKESWHMGSVDDSVKVKQINSGIEAMKIFYKKYYEKKYNRVVTGMVYFGMSLLKVKRLLLRKE